MEYQIKKIDINNESSQIAITKLINETFNLEISKDKIFLNTNTRNEKTLYLGAYLNSELAAVNIFISHELMYNNENVIAYQSCWSATSKNHRRKGLFSMLINNAKETLDGAFIFGFPNSNSSPIFKKKLGFREIGLSKINIPVKLFSNLFFYYYLKRIESNYQLSLNNCFIPIESELIDLKTKEYQDDIKTYGSYNNIIWGKIVKRTTKIGSLTFFNIGGIQVNKPHLLNLVFKEIVKKEKPDYIQLIISSNSSIWDLFRFKIAASKTEALIIYDLKIKTENSRFNFVTGIKDVF